MESWGFSYGEALAFVTLRAVAEARRVAEEARLDGSDACVTPDGAMLTEHLNYLGELRSICQMSAATIAGRS